MLDRPDQAEVALLDQVEERHAAAGEALGHRHHQPQVGLQQVVPGPGADLGDPLQVDALARGQAVAAVSQLPLGGQARLDPLGQFGLLLGGEPGYLADLLQVLPDRVGVVRFRVLAEPGPEAGPPGCGVVPGAVLRREVLPEPRVEIGHEQVLGFLAFP